MNYFNFSKEYIVTFLGLLIVISFKLVPQVIALFTLINSMKNSEPSARILNVHGLVNRDTCLRFGYVSRMDTIQAAILRIKLYVT